MESTNRVRGIAHDKNVAKITLLGLPDQPGIAANIFTTIGPLSFTIAQNISKATNDETESFNFRLGTSF